MNILIKKLKELIKVDNIRCTSLVINNSDDNIYDSVIKLEDISFESYNQTIKSDTYILAVHLEPILLFLYDLPKTYLYNIESIEIFVNTYNCVLGHFKSKQNQTLVFYIYLDRIDNVTKIVISVGDLYKLEPIKENVNANS